VSFDPIVVDPIVVDPIVVDPIVVDPIRILAIGSRLTLRPPKHNASEYYLV
jgi:hypothetical protein